MFNNRPAMRKNADSQPDMSIDRLAAAVESKEHLYQIRDAVQQRLLTQLDGDVSKVSENEVGNSIETFFNDYLDENNLLFTRDVRNQLLQWVTADILSYGPLDALLRDEDVTEIMVNGPYQVYVEQAGSIKHTDVVFENTEHLRRIIDRIVAPLGRRVDESSPMVDARLPSGYRVNATVPPLSLDGPLLTIRKFATKPFTGEDMVTNGTITEQLLALLAACVKSRINMVVSGGTGSGKTTMLNVVSSYVPEKERIITIEDTAELQLTQRHVVRLETRPPNIEGEGEITIRQLVINSLRMRPDRIIVGESRGGEALDMIQAMNTGHDGSMTTVHSNSARDTLRRIETMVLMAGMDLPLSAIREQVASSIQLIVHLSRLNDGSRRVMQVSEVQGMNGDVIMMQDLFTFEQEGFKDGKVIGKLRSTGLRPLFLEKFKLSQVEIDHSVFSTEYDF